MVYWKEGNKDKAIQVLKKALRIGGNFYDVENTEKALKELSDNRQHR